MMTGPRQRDVNCCPAVNYCRWLVMDALTDCWRSGRAQYDTSTPTTNCQPRLTSHTSNSVHRCVCGEGLYVCVGGHVVFVGGVVCMCVCVRACEHACVRVCLSTSIHISYASKL